MEFSGDAVPSVSVTGEMLSNLLIKPFQMRAERFGFLGRSLNRRIPDPRGFPLVKSPD